MTHFTEKRLRELHGKIVWLRSPTLKQSLRGTLYVKGDRWIVNGAQGTAEFHTLDIREIRYRNVIYASHAKS